MLLEKWLMVYLNDEWKVQVFANAGGGSLTVQAEGASFVAFKIIG